MKIKYNLYSEEKVNEHGLPLTFFVSENNPYDMHCKGYRQHDSSNNIDRLELDAEKLNKSQYYHVMGAIHYQHPRYELKVTSNKYFDVTSGEVLMFTTQDYEKAKEAL